MLTNDVISFEHLGPGQQQPFYKGKRGANSFV